jgi:hypothetical protein
MKINFKLKSILTRRIFIIAACLGGFSVILSSFLFTSIIRARIIDVDELVKNFEAQNQIDPFKPRPVRKVVIQQGFEHEKGTDARCLTWATEQVGSGWTQDSADHDFFIDYYVPPNAKAIICTTPALAAALTADADKPFLYEVYPTEYGLRVRIVIGVSEVREPCKLLTGNVNCLNFVLQQQAIVHYEQ